MGFLGHIQSIALFIPILSSIHPNVNLMILIEIKPWYEIASMVAQGLAAIGAILVIWRQTVNARKDSLRHESSLHQLAELADQSISQTKRMTDVALHLAKMVELYSHFSTSDMEFKKQAEEGERQRQILQARPMLTFTSPSGGTKRFELIIQNSATVRADVYNVETSPNITHDSKAPFSIMAGTTSIYVYIMQRNDSVDLLRDDFNYTLQYKDTLGNRYSQSYQQQNGMRITTDPVLIQD
jgi:hypothetical protein